MAPPVRRLTRGAEMAGYKPLSSCWKSDSDDYAMNHLRVSCRRRKMDASQPIRHATKVAFLTESVFLATAFVSCAFVHHNEDMLGGSGPCVRLCRMQCSTHERCGFFNRNRQFCCNHCNGHVHQHKRSECRSTKPSATAVFFHRLHLLQRHFFE